MRQHPVQRSLWLPVLWLALAAAQAFGGEPKPANVPPDLEIEVLDPNADPLGRPAVKLEHGEHGQLEVDIPPTVLVHRYYYSGNRSFQAQFLPGGPTIIAVSHPRSGERCYLDAQMPPGAPRVTYTEHSIDYDYGTLGVTVVFSRLVKPRVIYRTGVTLPQRAKKGLSHVGRETWSFVKSTGLPKRAGSAAHGAGNAARSAAEGVRQVTDMVVEPVHAIVERTPLGSILQDRPEQRAARLRDQSVESVIRERRLDAATIPTVR
ncbi:MAG: hypothetical protein U0836_17600 [Pirellulales bacterium]